MSIEVTALDPSQEFNVEQEVNLLASEVIGDICPDANDVDTMDKQLAAFDKLTAHAVSRYSTERFHRLLQRLGDIPFPQTPRRVAAGGYVPPKLDSVGKLREQLSRLKRKEKRSASDTQLLSACETFLRDVQYMRQVKKYFDEKVYCVLYKYFYDPSDVVDGELEKDSGIIDDSGSDSGGVFLTETEQPLEDHEAAMSAYGLDVSHLNDKEKLDFAVLELYNINLRWENLLNDDLILVELFEPDSEQDVRHLEPLESAGALLRLMPDVFVKCAKSAALAKLWWKGAASIYSITPGQPLNNTNYKERTRELKQQLNEKISEIRRMDHRLNINKQDLQFLESREERVSKLSSDCEKLENLHEELGGRYRDSIQNRQELMTQLNNTVQGTQKYDDINEKLKKMEIEVLNKYKELKFIEYNLGISRGDYSVELEVRPSFVHFSEGARQKVETLQKEIKDSQTQQRRLERKLVLVKTNHERMTEILVRVLGPEAAAANDRVRPITNKTYTIPRGRALVALEPADMPIEPPVEKEENLKTARSDTSTNPEKASSDDVQESEISSRTSRTHENGSVARVQRRRPPRIMSHSQPLGDYS